MPLNIQITEALLINVHNGMFEVTDNGIGISEEDLLHIFEQFYRADKSRTRATGGTGIGLAVARSIIERHGGTIEVESKLGRGSRFVVKLSK